MTCSLALLPANEDEEDPEANADQQSHDPHDQSGYSWDVAFRERQNATDARKHEAEKEKHPWCDAFRFLELLESLRASLEHCYLLSR